MKTEKVSPLQCLTRDLEFVRQEVDFELPLYEGGGHEFHDMNRDVSERGLGVAGLEGNAGHRTRYSRRRIRRVPLF